jgi:hypothetical protein
MTDRKILRYFGKGRQESLCHSLDSLAILLFLKCSNTFCTYNILFFFFGNNNRTRIRAGFEGSDPGRWPRGLHETEIKSADFIETFTSLK